MRIARAVRLALATSALLLFGMTTAAATSQPAAVTIDVTIKDFIFSPNTITIEKGDTIRWTNLDSAPHSAVSIYPGFITITLAQTQVTTTRFDSAGTFDYICGVHGASMRGVVVVRGIPEPTVVATANPAAHVVQDSFLQARPDLPLVSAVSGTQAFIYASAALALLALGRLAWVVRRS